MPMQNRKTNKQLSMSVNGVSSQSMTTKRDNLSRTNKRTKTKMLNKPQNDSIYPKQYIILFIVASLTYKMTMLPQYLCDIAGRNAYLSMAYMLVVEALMVGIIYGVISKGSLFELNIPKPLKCFFVIIIMLSNFVKGSLNMSGATSYISVTLFEKSSIIYVLCALLPIVLYMAHKGINVIGRTCQICFWFLVITFVYMFMFAQVDCLVCNLLPFKFGGDVFVACDKQLFWFSDFSPLLFASLVKTSKPTTTPTIAGLGFMIACPILLTIVFISNFGGGAGMVPNALGKLAVYNRISIMLGTVDFPTVCAWLIMSILKTSILAFGVVRGCKYFFGDKWWATVIVGLAFGAAIFFGARDLRTAFAISTSWVRYVIAIIEYGAPMAVYICMKIFDPERKQKLSTDQKRSAKNRRVQQVDAAKKENLSRQKDKETA